MGDIFGFGTIFAEVILALGAALVIGNGLAMWRHRQGRRPPGAEGELRTARATFLLAVGLVIGAWGAASLLAG